MTKGNGKLVTGIVSAVVVLGTAGAFGLSFRMTAKNTEWSIANKDRLHKHEKDFGHIGMEERVNQLQADVSELKDGQALIHRDIGELKVLIRERSP